MSYLSDAQQIFAVFYAIFFGTMLQTLGGRKTISPNKKTKEIFGTSRLKNASLNLFDSPNAFAIGCSWKNKPFWRLIFSTTTLNIIPGLIFALVFIEFGKLGNPNKPLEVWQIILIVWISLIPQQLYRLFYAILVRFSSQLFLKKGDGFDEYRDHDIAALVMLQEDRKQFEGHKKSVNHLAFPLFFYGPTFILSFWLLTKIDLTLFSIIYTIISGVLVFLLKERN